MAIGEPVVANKQTVDRIVRPAQVPAPWTTVIDIGGMIVQDAAAITDPTGEIITSTRHILNVKKSGTILRARMAYDDGDTLTTSPIVVAFGRYDANEVWQKLTNKAGITAVTMTVVTSTDVSDGTLNFTDVDPEDHAWDLDGCDAVLFGVQTIYAVSGGSAALASLQARVI